MVLGWPSTKVVQIILICFKHGHHRIGSVLYGANFFKNLLKEHYLSDLKKYLIVITPGRLVFKIVSWPGVKALWGQGSHETLPSTLHIMWSMHLQSLKCYVQRFRRKCACKKIHSLTLTLGSHEMLPSSVYIMWPMHMRSSNLLGPTV